MNPLSIAVIGAGRWGKVLLRNLAADERFRVAHLITSRPENAGLLPYSAAVNKDWQTALDDPDCKGVFIATPPATHYAIAEAALRAGKTVWIEKPLCMDVRQAEDLLRLQQAQGAAVWVNHIHVSSQWYRLLKSTVTASGEAIRAVVAEGMSFGPFREHTPALWDWGPHDVALCLDLLGTYPETVAALGGPGNQETGPEQFALRLDFPQCSAWIHCGRLAAAKRRTFSVYTETQRYLLTDRAATNDCRLTVEDFRFAERNQAQAAAEPRPLHPQKREAPLLSALDAFFAIMNTPGPSEAGLELAVDTVKVLSACEEQLKTRNL